VNAFTERSLGQSLPCRSKGVLDVGVGIVGDAGAVTGVKCSERLVDLVEQSLDAGDECGAVAFRQIRPAETPASEHQVAREEHPRSRVVETEVVVLVAGGVQGAVVVVAHGDCLTVPDSVVDEVVVGIEPPDVDVEGFDDGRDGTDVVGVRVRQDDCVESPRRVTAVVVSGRRRVTAVVVEATQLLANGGDGVEVVSRVDQDGSFAGDEKGVTGEHLSAGGEVRDHGGGEGGEGEPFSLPAGWRRPCAVDGSTITGGYWTHRAMWDENQPAGRVEMSDADRPVVLIVEDEPDVAETYRLWLDADYVVRMAHSGDEGLDELDESVDVVLLDRMMPGLSGDEVLERIRDRELDCRVAMVTAVEPDFDILEMGFDAYLCKPIKSDQLHETVENLIGRSEYDDLLQEYYSLVEKQATLEAAKSDAELTDNEEYGAVQERIDELQGDLSETLDGIDSDEDFIATLRGLNDFDE